jgi:hypothetical protein
MTYAPIRFSMMAASFEPTPGSAVVAANSPKISLGRRGCKGGAFQVHQFGFQITLKRDTKQNEKIPKAKLRHCFVATAWHIPMMHLAEGASGR